MDPIILLRLLPALAVATVVAWWVGRRLDVPRNDAVDEVLRAVVVGGVAARLGWLVLGGPAVWRSAPTTVLLVRAGVETWIGVAVAAGWSLRRPGSRGFLLAAGPAAALAGVGVWHAGCQLEGVCAGVAVAWGVRLPGYLSRVAPVAYLEAVLALLLAGVALRWWARPGVTVAALAGYAFGRGILGFAKAPLTTLPTRDMVLSFVAAALLATAAWRLRKRRVDVAS